MSLNLNIFMLLYHLFQKLRQGVDMYKTFIPIQFNHFLKNLRSLCKNTFFRQGR